MILLVDSAFARSDLGLHCLHMIRRHIFAYWGSNVSSSSCNSNSIYTLTLSTLGKIFSWRHFEIYFSNFSQQTGFDISCKLSPKETICIKCQILFSGKNKKNFINSSSAENAQRGVKVKKQIIKKKKILCKHHKYFFIVIMNTLYKFFLLKVRLHAVLMWL